MSKFHICPVTYLTCEEADTDCCAFTPNISQHHNSCCPSNPCIDCYCCIPLTIIIDVICFPVNIYYSFCKSHEHTITNQHIAMSI